MAQLWRETVKAIEGRTLDAAKHADKTIDYSRWSASDIEPWRAVSAY